MNKRQTKKRNKKFLESILDSLPWNVSDATFGNGYFLFKFGDNTVCHFRLKEFPDWKFGIWLTVTNKIEFQIFGELICLIDKFKPSRTFISEESVEKFVSALSSDSDDMKEHLSAGKEESKRLAIQQSFYNECHTAMLRAIRRINETLDGVEIVLEDQNTNFLFYVPRWEVSLYGNGKCDIKNIFKELCESFPKRPDYIYLDEGYLFGYYNIHHPEDFIGEYDDILNEVEESFK